MSSPGDGICQGDGEAREGSHPKHGAHHQSASGQGQALRPDDISQVDDDDGVSSAPPVVDAFDAERQDGVFHSLFPSQNEDADAIHIG